MSESEKPINDERVDQATNEAVWHVVRILQAKKDGSSERIVDGAVFNAEAVAVWNEGWEIIKNIIAVTSNEMSEESLASLTDLLTTYLIRLKSVRHTVGNELKDVNSTQLLAIIANKINGFLPTLSAWQNKAYNSTETIDFIKEDAAKMKNDLVGIV